MRIQGARYKELQVDSMEGHVDVDGYPIRYIGGGEGPPMLLLHGEETSYTTWLQNIGPLSRFFSLYAPELPGLQPASSLSLRRSDLDRAADILYRFTIALDIERAHLVGFSSGTAVADLFSLRHPDRVHRLIFVSGLGLLSTTESTAKDITEEALDFRDVNRESLLRRAVLIITGESDPLIRCESVRFIIARNPLARWVVIPDGGHRIHEEHPQELNQQIISYCIDASVKQLCG